MSNQLRPSQMESESLLSRNIPSQGCLDAGTLAKPQPHRVNYGLQLLQTEAASAHALPAHALPHLKISDVIFRPQTPVSILDIDVAINATSPHHDAQHLSFADRHEDSTFKKNSPPNRRATFRQVVRSALKEAHCCIVDHLAQALSNPRHASGLVLFAVVAVFLSICILVAFLPRESAFRHVLLRIWPTSVSPLYPVESCPALSSTPKTLPVPDVAPRFPDASALGLLRLVDYIGTAAFAASGATTAAYAGMDILGGVVVGTITAVGGGTLRDAFLLARPPFWVFEVEYLYLSCATAASSFLLLQTHTGGRGGAPKPDGTFWTAVDAAGVAAFAVGGAIHAPCMRMSPSVAIVAAMMTATFGGFVRDVACRQPVRILHSVSGVYASAAAAGGAAYVLLRATGGDVGVRVGGAAMVAFALRMWAWRKGVQLPGSTVSGGHGGGAGSGDDAGWSGVDAGWRGDDQGGGGSAGGHDERV